MVSPTTTLVIPSSSLNGKPECDLAEGQFYYSHWPLRNLCNNCLLLKVAVFMYVKFIDNL
jgi:hypothetical protein